MIKRGIRLLEEKTGDGCVAKLDDHLIFNLRIYLNRGEEIPINDLNEPFHGQLNKYHLEKLTFEEGYEFVNFITHLGQSDTIKGVQYSLYGMREGGFRKVKVSPNLAYRMKGIPGTVPPNAAIVFEIWLRKIIKKTNERSCQEK
jgi:hypothetical protein